MTRRLPVLLLLLLFALPTAAEARTKSVKVRMPAEGDISFARYVVTTAKPEDLTIRNARRLGSSMIMTGVRPLSRRRYEVTAMLVNPGAGAGAAQRRAFDLVFESVENAKIAVTLVGLLTEAFSEPVTRSESAAVNRFCEQPPPRRIRRRGRGFFESRGGSAGNRRRVRVLFTPQVCQDEPATVTAPASRQLRELGVDVPGCFGRVERYAGSPNEVSARMVCTRATNVFSLRAPAGNQGTNCLGPPQSACAYGQFCAPMPRESTCYGDSDGFASDTLLEFRARFAQPVEPQDIRGTWVAQGSPVVTEQHAYLRHVLDTP